MGFQECSQHGLAGIDPWGHWPPIPGDTAHRTLLTLAHPMFMFGTWMCPGKGEKMLEKHSLSGNIPFPIGHNPQGKARSFSAGTHS